MIDKEISNIEIDDKVKDKKYIKYIMLVIMIVISLIGIFFISTYLRWQNQINDLYEIIYYNQDDIKINNLEDFYGGNINIDITANEAMLLYCTSVYGGDCVTVDVEDSLENLFRNPGIVLNIIILFDLIIILWFIKEKDLGNIYVYVISSLIILFGLYGVGVRIYRIADYYASINNSEYMVSGTIIKGIVTNSENSFKPIIQYQTSKGDYTLYVDTSIKGTIDDKVGSKIDVYYDKKDNSKVTIKQSMIKHLFPIIISILTVFVGFLYLKKLKRKDKYTIDDHDKIDDEKK